MSNLSKRFSLGVDKRLVILSLKFLFLVFVGFYMVVGFVLLICIDILFVGIVIIVLICLMMSDFGLSASVASAKYRL
jgi:hypothetical protein